jgi:tetratricopeptide (TPR) repeat protein
MRGARPLGPGKDPAGFPRFARARLLAALLILALAPAAKAESTDDPRAEGRRRFEAGELFFQHGQYASALVEYEAGYQLTRLPGFLINIAHCHRLSGDRRKARAFYRKYLLVEPTSPRKAEVEEIIRKLDEALASEPEETPATNKEPRTPSVRWWLWSALASSVVGSTVATSALAASEEKR